MTGEKIISPMITRLKEDIEKNNNDGVEKFFNKIKSGDTPLVEDIIGESESALITFVYEDKENLKSIMVYGGVPGFNYNENQLEKINNINIWFKTYKVNKNIKFKYQFCKNYIKGDRYSQIKEKSILDPLNSRKIERCRDSEDPQSKEKVESYVEVGLVPKENWTTKIKGVREGEIKLYRKMFKNENRRIWVYTPYKYDSNSLNNNLLVLTDGFDYVNYLNTKIILDNLIHENKIDKTIAVFIENGNERDEELACNDKFADFIIKEVIPWVRENYNIKNV